MNQDDIREIIKIQLEEVGIEYNGVYLDIANNYFNEFLQLPSMEYMLNKYSEMFVALQNIPLLSQIQIIEHQMAEQENLEHVEENSSEAIQNSASSDVNNIVDANGEHTIQFLNLLNASNDDESDTDSGSDENEINDSAGILHNNFSIINQMRNLIGNSEEDDDDVPELVNNPRDIVHKVLINVDDIPLDFIKDQSQTSDNQCIICYDHFVPSDLIRVLPCTHKFHRRCIDVYLTEESYLCPLCRKAVGEYKLSNI